MTNAPVLTSAHDTLYRHLRVEPHCDILIDRMAAADLGDELTIWQNRGESVALSDTLFATMPEQSPLLLRLTLDDIELTEQLLDRTQTEAMTGSPTRSVCAFLFSHAPLAQLAKHLSTHLNAYMEGFGAIYFRYFDPRVWPHLQRIATPIQMHHLFGDLSAWLCMDSQGRLQTYTRPPEPHLAEVTSPRIRPTYSAAQWQQIERIETVNLTLQRLQQSGIPLPELARADEAVAVAATRVDAQGDQVTYSAYALAHGRTFTEHKQLAEALRLAHEHDIPLADVIEDRLQLALDPALPDTPLLQP